MTNKNKDLKSLKLAGMAFLLMCANITAPTQADERRTYGEYFRPFEKVEIKDAKGNITLDTYTTSKRFRELKKTNGQPIPRQDAMKMLGLDNRNCKLPTTDFVFKDGCLTSVPLPEVIVGDVYKLYGTTAQDLIKENPGTVIIRRMSTPQPVYFVYNAQLYFAVKLSSEPDLNGLDLNQETEKVLLDLFTLFLSHTIEQVDFCLLSHNDSKHKALESSIQPKHKALESSIQPKLPDLPQTAEGLLKGYLDATKLLEQIGKK